MKDTFLVIAYEDEKQKISDNAKRLSVARDHYDELEADKTGLIEIDGKRCQVTGKRTLIFEKTAGKIYLLIIDYKIIINPNYKQQS